MERTSTRRMAALALGLGAAITLTGCAGNDGAASLNTGTSALSSGEIAGGSIGAAAGGTAAVVAGADPTGVVAAIIGGLSAGAMAGGFLDGASGSASDTFSAIDSLDAGESRLWRDPEDDTSIITTTVQDVFAAGDGSLCKHYTEKRPAAQGVVTSSGTACRTPDGAWRPAHV